MSKKQSISVTFSVRIPDQLRETIKLISVKQKISMQEFAKIALKKLVAEYEKK